MTTATTTAPLGFADFTAVQTDVFQLQTEIFLN